MNLMLNWRQAVNIILSFSFFIFSWGGMETRKRHRGERGLYILFDNATKGRGKSKDLFQRKTDMMKKLKDYDGRRKYEGI